MRFLAKISLKVKFEFVAGVSADGRQMSIRELFEGNDERLLTYIGVSRPGKKAKPKSTYLCVVGVLRR